MFLYRFSDLRQFPKVAWYSEEHDQHVRGDGDRDPFDQVSHLWYRFLVFAMPIFWCTDPQNSVVHVFQLLGDLMVATQSFCVSQSITFDAMLPEMLLC